MAGFLLIVAFPLILATGFGGLYLAAGALGRSPALLDRTAVFLYPVLLAVPLSVALSSAWQRGLLVDTGLGPPRIGALGPAAALGLSLAGGVALGAALFYSELLVARALARSTRRRAGLHRVLEGRSQDFAAGTAPVPMTVMMLLSVYIVFAEEFLWRGYLLRSCLDVFGWDPASAVLLSAVLFGANHYYFGLRNVVFKGLAGAVWAVLLLTTGSLVAPFASHYAYETLVWQRLGR